MRAAAVLVLAFAAGCERVPTAPRATDPGPPDPKPAPAKLPAKGPAAKGPAGKSPPPKARTFESDLAAMWELAAAADAAEPGETARALALLTRPERLQAEAAMRASLASLPQTGPKLAGYGLTAWVGRQSRAVARESPDFPRVARKLWDESTAPGELLRAASAWATVPHLDHVLHAIDNDRKPADMTPQARDGVLMLGGERWLRR